METQKTTIAKLRKLYKQTAPVPYAPIFDFFAGNRKRNRSNTTVDSLIKALIAVDVHTTRPAIIQFFRDLQAAGVGQFKIGRQGAMTRIEWAYPLKDVGLAAQGNAENLGVVEVEPVKAKVEVVKPKAAATAVAAKPTAEAAAPKPATNHPAPEGAHIHHLLLGTGNRVQLIMPVKPAPSEVDEILDYLATLSA